VNIAVSIFALGVLIAFHELGHFAAARRTGMRVLRFSVGFFNAVWSHTSKRSGTTYQIGALPLGGFVQIKGMNPFEEDANTGEDSFQNKSIPSRFLVILAGPLVNFVIAYMILFALSISSGVPEPVDISAIGSVAKDLPADKAGLIGGDEILKANDRPLKTWTDLTAVLQANPDKEVRLDVRRKGKMLTLTVIPRNDDGIGRIGISPKEKRVSLSVYGAAVHALVKCGEITMGSLIAIGKLVSFQKSPGVKAVGLPGIIQMAAQAFDAGIVSFLVLLAYLSMMLFVFNLLPFPALDGGRGMFLLYEAVLRRKVNPKFDVVANSIGFFLLIGLMLFLSVKELIF
jgi:regulator of sigma E protease